MVAPASGQETLGPHSCPHSYLGHMGEVRSHLLPLNTKGQPGFRPFRLCWPEELYLGTLPFHYWGGKGTCASSVLLPQQLACQTLLAQPSSSSGSVWGRRQVPQICFPLQCLPWTQRAPYATQTIRAQGAGRAARLELVMERRCPIPICPLFSIFPLPRSIPCPASSSPKQQSTCSFQLLHPRSTSGPFRLSLAHVPRGGEQSEVPGLRFTQEGGSRGECKFV